MPVKVCGKLIFIKVYFCSSVTVQAINTVMRESLHPLCGHCGACRPQNPAVQGTGVWPAVLIANPAGALTPVPAPSTLNCGQVGCPDVWHWHLGWI